MIQRVSAYLWGRLGQTRVSARHEFPSPSAFARLLEIERHRADRIDSVFSLLTLTPKDHRKAARTYECLAALLPRRLRLTDHAGWLDDRRVGLIFPGTAAEGAWKVADDICLQFPDDVLTPMCTVLSYPSAEGGQLEERELEETGAPSGRCEQMETLFLIKTPLWKRTLDIVGAGIGLVLLSPLLLLVAALIKVTSTGPVLYTQMRSGQGGKPFRMYKFRSMVKDADCQKERLMALNEQDGPAFKIKNDPRVTRIGRFLRTTSIDELPQLWNILRGEMTFVGPRAMYCPEVERCTPWQKRRLDVRQGVTCIWQVSGRSAIGFDDWMRMDLQYIRRRSALRDLTLLVKTVPAVLSRRGAH